MKRLLTLFACIGLASASHAAPFSPGNIAVLRYGDGTQVLNASGNTIYIDQYTPSGALVSSIQVPDTGPTAMIGQGNSFVEGYLSLSQDGRYLVFSGYNTNRTYTGSVTGNGLTLPRAIGTVDYYGNYNLALTNSAMSSSSVRGAAFDGTNNYWEVGGITGVVHAGLSSSNLVSSAPLTNLRGLDIYNGVLYYSSGSGTTRGVYGLGGTPTTGPVTATNMVTSGVGSSPWDFVVDPTGTIVYLSDTSATNNPPTAAGITKFVLSGGIWQSNYTFYPNGTNCFGFTVDFSGANPIVYATTGLTNGNALVSIVDTGAAAAGATGTVLATAPNNIEFKGVRMVPKPIPAANAAFTHGNLAVVRVGGTGESVNSFGSSVHVDEYDTGGALVNTVAIPDSGANAFTLDSSSTEGYLTTAQSGGFLVLGGYNGPVGTGNGVTFGLSGTTSASVPRSIATIDGYGNVDVPIKNTQAYSAWNISSAAFDGGNNYWMAGQSNSNPALISVLYVGTPIAPTTVEVNTNANRASVLNIFNGSFFVASSFAPNGIFQIQNSPPTTPLPETFNQATPVISLPGTSRNSDFAFDAGMTTCYYADSSTGIVKYTNNAGTWTSAYTIPATNAGGFTSKGARALTVDFSQNPAVIYATTSETAGNRLIKLVDTGGAAVATMLAQASTNVSGTNAFRGVRFAPGQGPVITAGPVDANIIAGANASFSVSATGPSLAYQWFTNGVAIPWGTTASITLTNVPQALDSTPVYVNVSNAYGSTNSTNAHVYVVTLIPRIVSVTPTNQIINATSNATFTVSALNATGYSWYKGSTLLQDGGKISGATTATLTITGALQPDDGSYFIVASNQYGFATNEVADTLMVNDPVIIVPPMGTTNLPGSSYTFTVTAVGSGPLTYAWLTNGVQDTSVNPLSSSYPINNALAGSNIVAVVVSNIYGSWVSSATGSSTGGAIFYITPYLILDDFSYADGNITTTSAGAWNRSSGSSGDSDVTNVLLTDIFGNTGTGGVYEVSQHRQDDVARAFSFPLADGVVYASFTINMQELPSNPGGSYFANFSDSTQFSNVNRGYWGRIFACTTNTTAPGTWRLGIANSQGDYSSTATGPTGPYFVLNPDFTRNWLGIYPLDLATNIPYQVVVQYDIDAQVTTLWVNPESSTDANVVAQDFGASGASYTPPLGYFDYRQNGGEGVMYIDNLRVAEDFADVTTNTAALAQIGVQPSDINNYKGNNLFVQVAATGKGIGYQWHKNNVSLGSDATNATQPLVFKSSADSGSYTVVLTTDAGSITSDVAVVTISDANVAPSFNNQPSDVTAILGGTTTFTGGAIGTGPITYQWYVNHGGGNIPIADNGLTIIGAATARLFLSHIDNSEAGTYYLQARGAGGNTFSTGAALTVQSPPFVSILSLLQKQNPDTGTVLDTSLYGVVGTITTYTNLTTANTSSYYIQDSTGGINLFITGDSSFRPAIGSQVIATGVLDIYPPNTVGAQIELYVDATKANNVYFVQTDSKGSNIVNNLPAPIVVPLDFLANPANQDWIITNLDGSLVMVTNVYFSGTAGTFATNSFGTFTFQNGQGSATVYQPSTTTNNFQGVNSQGLPIPAFSYSLTGPLVANGAGSWEIDLTTNTQFVTNPPPAPTMSASSAGGVTSLTWPAVPYSYAYTVLGAPVVTGPYAPTGGTVVSSATVFTNTAGLLRVTNAGAMQYYRTVVP